MGTSSIYKGPKKTILLPDDYSDDNDLNDVSNFPSDEERRIRNRRPDQYGSYFAG